MPQVDLNAVFTVNWSMAHIYDEPSRTFGEFLLIPNLTRKGTIPARVDLKTPVVRYTKGSSPPLSINVPITAAMMQSVSDDKMAIALARCGGLAFIFGSQSIASQAEMVRRVKNHKAGFVVSDSNVRPSATLADVLAATETTGHSTIAVTEDGTPTGRLVGMVTGRDYRPGKTPPTKPVTELMTPFDALTCGKIGLDLEAANDLIWSHKLNCLPVIDEMRRLHYLVFRKDYDAAQEFPLQLVDDQEAPHRRCGHQLARPRRTRPGAGRSRRRSVVHRFVGRIFGMASRHDWVREEELRPDAHRRRQCRRSRRLPVSGRGRRRLREGRHRRRIDLHHARTKGHRSRSGDGA